MRPLVIIICVGFSIVSYAQESSPPDFTFPKTLIKLSPLQLFTNTLELGIESFNPSFSKSFQGSLGFRSGSNDFRKGKGASIEVAYRKYVSPMKYQNRRQRESYQGVYYSIYLNGTYFKGTENDYYYYDPNTGAPYQTNYTEITNAVSPGFTIGMQKTLWKVLVLDVFVGGGIRFADVSRTDTVPYYSSYTVFEPGYEGIYPKIGAKIGVGL